MLFSRIHKMKVKEDKVLYSTDAFFVRGGTPQRWDGGLGSPYEGGGMRRNRIVSIFAIFF